MSRTRYLPRKARTRSHGARRSTVVEARTFRATASWLFAVTLSLLAMPTARAADLLLIGGQGDDVSVAAAAIRMQNWKAWGSGSGIGRRLGGRMAGGCMGCVVVHGNRSTGGRWKFHLGAQSETDVRTALIDVRGVRFWASPALRFKNRYGSQLRLRVPVWRVLRYRRGPRFTTALLVGCASPACLEWQHQKSERRNNLCASVNAISFLASKNPTRAA